LQLFQTPSTCCVGLCNADPIRWRQPRIPADSIFATSVVETPSFPSPSSQSQPPPRLPRCANDQPALTDRTRSQNSIFFLFYRLLPSQWSVSGQSIEKDHKEKVSSDPVPATGRELQACASPKSELAAFACMSHSLTLTWGPRYC
jgi:hypothetical protein